LGGTAGLAQEEERNEDYQYALIEAVKQKNLGNLPEAVKLYRLVIREKPDCDAAHYELGSIYLMINQVELAEKSLETAYRLDPDNRWYTLAYLNALGTGEKFDTIENILEEKILKEPDEVEWEYQLATVYYSQGKQKKAIKKLEEIEQKKGFSEKVSLLKSSIYENEERYELALEELEQVMALFPEEAQLRIKAAELCNKSGREDQAAAYYLEILETDSLNIFALTNLTDYYRKKKDFRKSFSYMAKSFRNTMIDARRKMAILSLYLSEEKYVQNYQKELDHLLEVLISVHPEAWEARLLASDFYIQTRNYEKAYWQMKAYLKEKGGAYQMYMQTILLANAGGLDEELVKMTEEALRLYPDSADIRFFRGIGFYELGNYKALIDNFDSVSFRDYSMQEYTVQSKMLYAEAFYRLNDFERSDSLFEALIREDPENYTALNNYSYYLAERGVKLESAESWSKTTIEMNPDNATFLDTYAWVLFKLKDYENAEKYILLALDKGGDNDPDINEHAGDIQAAMDSPEIAKSYYMKAIILGGDKQLLEKKIQALMPGENE
jgi:tetratricopeptide (TPR) repeat protein